eukprot:s269_g13.t1
MFSQSPQQSTSISCICVHCGCCCSIFKSIAYQRCMTIIINSAMILSVYILARFLLLVNNITVVSSIPVQVLL